MTPTLPEALQTLQGWLPPNPADDTLQQAAARVVVEACDGIRPVTWLDDDAQKRNTWSRNSFTNELEPDLDGDPLYTTTPPAHEKCVEVGFGGCMHEWEGHTPCGDKCDLDPATAAD